MSTLYIVATPIGNLEDISMRALRILGEVDFVLCEDTRVTGVLLSHYKIKTKTISYHQHSDIHKLDQILKILEEGKDLALVSDAGTPGISDPGGKLVQAVLEKFGDDVKIESVPGPSAVAAALSISGIATDKFIFLGFPPHKKGRQTFIEKILESDFPVVVYESKHRILKFLDELKTLNQNIEKRNKEIDELSRSFGMSYKSKDIPIKQKEVTSVVVCREISKMHETVYRGDIKSIKEKIQASNNDLKGEFVVIIGK
jgi:16S rRNA (cytidine1402-2'-O)-methyltransferase